MEVRYKNSEKVYSIVIVYVVDNDIFCLCPMLYRFLLAMSTEATNIFITEWRRQRRSTLANSGVTKTSRMVYRCPWAPSGVDAKKASTLDVKWPTLAWPYGVRLKRPGPHEKNCMKLPVKTAGSPFNSIYYTATAYSWETIITCIQNCGDVLNISIEETYTHKSAKIHAGNVFVTRSWPWSLTFNPKINRFQGLVVKYYCANFIVNLTASVFQISSGKTDRHTDERR